MASVATSNITNISRLVAGGKGVSNNWGNQPAEIFRIASGQAPGDTAVLQSPNIPNILAVIGPGTNNIGTSPTGVTAVTVTLAAVTGSAITVTVGATDWVVLGPLPQA
jgi:hypothetical protein